MVDLYADEGITGTSAKKRKEFQRLLTDCRKGKIDRILVKSISRFARNTKECLEAIRELKQLGVSIYFEEQGIDTSLMTGEMLTAVFASFAQAESQSISGNMQWSYQKRMEAGTFNTCKAPFGYRLIEGVLVIHPQEAEMVKLIFDRFLVGESCEKIAEHINTLEFPKQYGKSHWRPGMIRYILRNERYVGNAVLQKKYTTDTFPRQKKRNHGTVPQYLVAESNPPIISREIFDAAQALIEQRYKTVTTTKTPGLPLAQKIADLSSQDQMLTQLKKQGLIDPDIFISQQNSIAQKIRAAKQERAKLLDTDEDTTLQNTQEILDVLESGLDFPDTFDGEMFRDLVEQIIVESNKQLCFRLKNGLEMMETIERTGRYGK